MAKVRVATIVLGTLSASFVVLTCAYLAYALDPLTSNGGAFGVAVSLLLFGVPAFILGWLAVRSHGASLPK